MSTGKLYSDYPIDIYNLTIVLKINSQNKIQYSFNKRFVDITPKPISVEDWDGVSRWYSDRMLFYSEQYKYALYCATYGCGISKDHLTQGFDYQKSIYLFHVMYQTKKILHQMNVRSPGDTDFDLINNPYSKTEYQKLQNEFYGCKAPEIDQPANGLGYVITPRGKQRDEYLEYIHKLPNFPSTGKPNNYINIKIKGSREHNDYPEWGTYFQFAKEANSSVGISMNKVQQDTFNYLRVIPDHPAGNFTPAGLVRLNDSIRTYIYCLLGAQVQARAAAEGNDGKSLASQEQFLVLVNDIINKSQSLEESVKNFQDALSKTEGKTNYILAKGLYIIPSNLNLNKLGKSVTGFNDKILVAKQFDGVGIQVSPASSVVSKTRDSVVPKISPINSNINKKDIPTGGISKLIPQPIASKNSTKDESDVNKLLDKLNTDLNKKDISTRSINNSIMKLPEDHDESKLLLAGGITLVGIVIWWGL